MRWLLLAALAACRYGDAFHCETNAQCVTGGGETGACVAGSCAFSDDSCASGWRYDESAQDDVAGGCLEGNAPADCAAWTPHHFAPCALPAPLGDLKLTSSGYVFDTDRGVFIGGPDVAQASIALPQADGTAVRVLSVQSFSLSSNIRLRVTGSMPLVIASWSTITVAGHIDATSTANDLLGPGANFAGCTSNGKQGMPGAASKGSGGGGGGGFGGAGGTGGEADETNTPVAGGAGGTAVTGAAAIVHGGCRGGAGGALGPAAGNPSAAAAGGEGGGAVLLAARTSIAVSGIIDAGGAGGAGGTLDEGGGGGGGSGGYIGLDAPAITVTGVLAANGGGGGGGGGGTAAGGNGADGKPSSSAAGGGSAGDGGSSGGAGSAGSTATGANVSASAGLSPTGGGGGGGGGAGVIALHGTPTTTGATISPPVTIDP